MPFLVYDKTIALRRKLPIAINDLKSETLSSFTRLDSTMTENEIVKISLDLAGI